MNATEAYTRLKCLRSSFTFKINLKISIFKIKLKYDIYICDEIDVTFSMGCVLYQSEPVSIYLADFLILKVIFILFSGFAGRDIK